MKKKCPIREVAMHGKIGNILEQKESERIKKD